MIHRSQSDTRHTGFNFLLKVKHMKSTIVCMILLFLLPISLFSIYTSIGTALLLVIVITILELGSTTLVSNYIAGIDTTNKLGGTIFSLSKFYLGIFGSLLLTKVNDIIKIIENNAYYIIVVSLCVLLLIIIIRGGYIVYKRFISISGIQR